MTIARGNGTYLTPKYRRVASRRGPIKAIVAVERAILIAIRHMASNGVAYRDPGPDFYVRLNPDKTESRALAQLRTMGHGVTITPTNTSGHRAQLNSDLRRFIGTE